MLSLFADYKYKKKFWPKYYLNWKKGILIWNLYRLLFESYTYTSILPSKLPPFLPSPPLIITNNPKGEVWGKGDVWVIGYWLWVMGYWLLVGRGLGWERENGRG